MPEIKIQPPISSGPTLSYQRHDDGWYYLSDIALDKPFMISDSNIGNLFKRIVGGMTTRIKPLDGTIERYDFHTERWVESE